jgi:hypothetical protein
MLASYWWHRPICRPGVGILPYPAECPGTFDSEFSFAYRVLKNDLRQISQPYVLRDVSHESYLLATYLVVCSASLAALQHSSVCTIELKALLDVFCSRTPLPRPVQLYSLVAMHSLL